MFWFEWDPEKAQANRAKHGISFEDVTSAFADPLSLTIPDPDHSEEEERYILMGMTRHGTLVVVVHLDLGDAIRIISARKATRTEQRHYEEGEHGH